ncbi:MAG: calcium-binding protein [Hellea sp.]
MRKLNFDNLGLLSDEITLKGVVWIDAFKAPFLDMPLFAPQPGPLFADIDGTSNDDVITGTSGDDILNGLEGDDLINGGAGNDTINGGDGDDVLSGNSGDDILDGGTGNDVLNGGMGNDTIYGGSDVDIINGNDGDDILYGDVGNDIAGNDVINGGMGNDAIYGWYGADILSGDSGDDVLYGGGNDDVLYGGDGADTLRGGDGNNTLYGGDGDDVFYTTGYGSDVLHGGAGNDTINLGSSDDIVYGDAGDDIIYSSGTQNFIDGGDGIDTYIAFNFNADDLLSVSEVAPGIYTVIYDRYFTSPTQTTYPTINVLTNVEFIRSGGTNGTDIALSSFGQNDTNLSEFKDVYRGSNFADRVYGFEGDDSFAPNGGDDFIDGGVGQDTVEFDFETLLDFEVLWLGGDNYTVATSVSYAGDAQTNILHNVELLETETYLGDLALLAQFYTMDTHLTTGDDTFIGSNVAEGINGREGDDTIQGLGGDDIILAGRGKDIIYGGDGNDFIRGGEAGYRNYTAGDDDDILYGGAGDDVIEGGEGNDYIIGGLGADDLDGGRGIDTLSYEDSSAAVYVNLRLGVTRWAADGDTVANFEILIGSDFNDNLGANTEGGMLMGGLGDDILNGSTVGTTNTLTGTAVYLEASRENITVTLVEPGVHTVTTTGATNEGTDTLNEVDGIRLGGVDGTFYLIDYFVTGIIYLRYPLQPFSGYSADETITGTNSADVFDGGTGNNFLYGLGGDDIITSLGNDVIDGGTGDDLIEMGGNVFDASTATDGGSGIDTISFSTLSQFPSGNLFFVLDLLSQSYSVRDGSTVLYVDQFSNFENAAGSEYRDLLQGGEDANTLRGLAGDDTLQGRGGSDFLEGGTGDDSLSGGDGVDTAVFSSADRNDYQITETASGEYTVTALNGVMDGTDSLVGVEYIQFGADSEMSFDIARLLAGQIAIRLTNENDEFTGTAENEIINGLSGNDIINGGLGANIIGGNAGNDTLISLGSDFITGGAGNDIIELGLNVSGGQTTIDGGTEYDIISFQDMTAVDDGMGGSSTVVTIDLAAGNYTLYADGVLLSSGSVSGVEAATGSEFRDVITGDAQNNNIEGLGGNDVIYGGDGNDTLRGYDGDDMFYGEAGNDHIYGGNGNDFIDGGNGIDRLYGNNGDDTIFGGAGNDWLYGGNNDDHLDGGADDDKLYGGGGNNVIYGGDGDDDIFGQGDSNQLYGGDGDDYVSGGIGSDIMYGGNGVDTLWSGNGNDTVYGEAGDDSLRGGNDDDILFGGIGDDSLRGENGNDTLFGGAGYDSLDGGVGIDIADYSQSLVFMFYDYTGAIGARGDVVLDTLISIEAIRGTGFDDRLYGDDAVSTFYGGDGDDLLVGRGGDDILSGGAGNDTLDGGDGIDMAVYSLAASYIVYDFLGVVAAQGEITNDTLISIEAIRGTAFNDRLLGGNDASIFYGGEGADRLFGRNGDDELYGEGGDDIILGGRDNDIVDGGGGNDQLRGNEGDDTLLGGDGNDILAGGAGADAMDGGAGIDRVEYTYGTNAGVTASLGDASINTGDAAGDTYVNIENLYGTSFVDTLYGDAGNNRIDGRLGDDALFGGEGNDYLLGGAGNDVLNGEGGNDLLLGQAGTDIYQFDAAHGTDRIVVFVQGEDLIEFTENVFDFSGLTITQDGAHVNIVSSEGTIIVNNSLVADFAVDDFIFASPPSQEPLDLDERDITEQDMTMFVEVDALI